MTSALPHELSESIWGPSLLHRATDCWLDVCMSWRAKAFGVSRWRPRGGRDRIYRGDYRTRRRISDCIRIVHAHRGIFRERRDGGGLLHVLRGSCAYAGGEVFPDHEWRRTRLVVLLGFLFHYLLRAGTLEHRCAMVQRQKQSGVHLIQTCSDEEITEFRCQLFENTDRSGSFLD